MPFQGVLSDRFANLRAKSHFEGKIRQLKSLKNNRYFFKKTVKKATSSQMPDFKKWPFDLRTKF